ncbi:unnamed protein product [Caenorhabditis nigoni]
MPKKANVDIEDVDGDVNNLNVESDTPPQRRASPPPKSKPATLIAAIDQLIRPLRRDVAEINDEDVQLKS